eukprot:6404287-Prymnesium_polylepis.1
MATGGRTPEVRSSSRMRLTASDPHIGGAALFRFETKISSMQISPYPRPSAHAPRTISSAASAVAASSTTH